MESSINIVKQLNLSVFRFFNDLFGQKFFDNLMIVTHNLADPHLLPYHFLLIAFFLSIMLFFAKKDKERFKKLAIISAISLISFFLSLSSLALVYIFKNYTEVARPFCSLENIYFLESITKELVCNQSFPSGHVTLATLFTVSFWSMFNSEFKVVAVLSTIMIAITRISSGAHYPIDIIGALAISLPLALYTRVIVTKFVIQYMARS